MASESPVPSRPVPSRVRRLAKARPDVVWLNGTFCSSGIGRSTVKLLALRGAKVYLAARSESRAREAIDELQRTNLYIRQDQLHHVPLDLTDLKSIVAAADKLKATETKIDILSRLRSGKSKGVTDRSPDCSQ